MKVITLVLGISIVTLVWTVIAPTAHAVDLDALRERIEQRREERRMRLEERKNTRASEAPVNSPEQNNQEGVSSEENEPCTCSAKLKLSRPRLFWGSGGLVFVPTVDVDIRTKGNPENSDWNLQLNYQGKAHDTLFQGEEQWGGQCMDGRLRHKGLELPSVTMDNLLRAMFLNDEELVSKVGLQAAITGCAEEQEEREFSFSIKNDSKLYVKNWRNTRK